MRRSRRATRAGRVSSGRSGRGSRKYAWPGTRRIHARDASVRGVAGREDAEVGVQREGVGVVVGGVREVDRSRGLAGLEEEDGLAEYAAGGGAVDLVDHEDVLVRGGLVVG